MYVYICIYIYFIDFKTSGTMTINLLFKRFYKYVAELFNIYNTYCFRMSLYIINKNFPSKIIIYIFSYNFVSMKNLKMKYFIKVFEKLIVNSGFFVYSTFNENMLNKDSEFICCITSNLMI